MKIERTKEFDIIANDKHEDSRSGEKFHFLAEKDFNDLVDFIENYEHKNKENNIEDFMKINHNSDLGYYVSLKNYVGIIQPNSSLQVEILPKIDYDKDSDDEDFSKTKGIFLNMLKSLKQFKSKSFSVASLQSKKMPLYEIFISMYLQEVRQLVKHGLKSAYTEQEDNLPFYKGKLMLNQHLLRNLAHKERFYVAFDEYSLNRAENKLVKATLLKLGKVTTSTENSKLVRQLLMDFELVEESKNYDKDFSKVSLDRNTKDYEMLMQWSKVFLLNKSYTPFGGFSDANSILFPMEKLYESYIAQQVEIVFGEKGWKVSAQDHEHHLFKVGEQEKFSLRPDIVIKRKGSKPIIMDTKWKRLKADPDKNYGISQADMYQMYAYGKKYGASEIWLLYPLNNEMRGRKDIVYRSKDKNDEVVVHVFFTDLEHIDESMANLLKRVTTASEVHNL